MLFSANEFRKGSSLVGSCSQLSGVHQVKAGVKALRGSKGYLLTIVCICHDSLSCSLLRRPEFFLVACWVCVALPSENVPGGCRED